MIASELYSLSGVCVKHWHYKPIMGNGVSFPLAALHWYVPCYVGMGGLFLVVRATALLARLGGPKAEITSCCLLYISKFQHKLKKKKEEEKGRQLSSAINLVSIAVTTMWFPRFFISVGCKVYTLQLLKKGEKSFSHFGILLCVKIFEKCLCKSSEASASLLHLHISYVEVEERKRERKRLQNACNLIVVAFRWQDLCGH